MQSAYRWLNVTWKNAVKKCGLWWSFSTGAKGFQKIAYKKNIDNLMKHIHSIKFHIWKQWSPKFIIKTQKFGILIL